MKPDEPFNYWQNTPATAVPPVAAPPVAAPPVAAPSAAASPVQRPAAPLQPTVPVAAVSAVAPSAPIIQPIAPSLPDPAPTSVAQDIQPTTLYAPTEVNEPELPDGNEANIDAMDVDPGDGTNDEQYDGEPVHWAATEFVAQEKNSIWFFVCILVVAGLIALDIFVLKSYTFSALVIVMAAALLVLSRRPPTEIDYTLSPGQGIYVGQVLHEFEEFKSFGVINDHGNNFVKLIPVKRFGLGVSVYFPVELGEQIVDILGSVLPMEDLKLDVFDAVVRKLRL